MRKNRKTVKAAMTAAAMVPVLALSGCSAGDAANGSGKGKEKPHSTYAEDLGVPINVICDSEGNPIDLGGMEIIIRDWWSSGVEEEPMNEYQEARQSYRDWIQETYNFTIQQVAMSDWGSTVNDFLEYVSSGGDKKYYLWTMREDYATVCAMMTGMVYDLSTLDCLDFSDAKFQRNKLHEQYSIGDSIYGMYVGYSEPRTGVYFNKDILENAGIDPDSIYDMQQDGTWTWEEFDHLMGLLQRDIDGDGYDDVYGVTANEGSMTKAALYSNGGDFIGVDENGKFIYQLENPENIEALEWVVQIYDKYDNHDPDDAAWDYYKEEFLSGKVAFLVEDEYAGTPGNYLDDAGFDMGFVMFPKGPRASTYVNCWNNNPVFIPNVYDAETAWKIAFAYDLYTNEPIGYEDYIDLDYVSAGVFDDRAVNETILPMMQPEHGFVSYTGMLPNVTVGDYLWYIEPGTNVNALITQFSDYFKEQVQEANDLAFPD